MGSKPPHSFTKYSLKQVIFYYSATGNTRFAARYLAEKLHTEAVDILKSDSPFSIPDEKETIGIMFPIYCWGIPPVVERFLQKIVAEVPAATYVWGVCTCGDEAGTAMKRFNALFEKGRGRGADAIFSVTMPNTYVMLPGFDVDNPEVEKRKLDDAPLRLDNIADAVAQRKRDIYDVAQGSLPALRSAIFPIFKKWGVTTKWWHVADNCIGCGKCAKICPAGNIKMKDSRPEWGCRCFSCCACYHCCPVKAISYASFTKNKSQYLCPLHL